MDRQEARDLDNHITGDGTAPWQSAEMPWTPGLGWRPLYEHEVANGRDMIAFHPGDTDEAVLWVRDDPVPPLPTDPYTVIRVTWNEASKARPNRVYTLDAEGRWWPLTTGEWNSPALFRERITGFEVLSEPRHVTAKAVLTAIRETTGDDYFNTVISEQFGVSDV